MSSGQNDHLARNEAVALQGQWLRVSEKVLVQILVQFRFFRELKVA
jgi:hypothetical protein